MVRKLLSQVGFFLFCCLIIEAVLRIMGYGAGDLKPKWLNFHPVDSLYVIHDFYTNADGILVGNRKYFEEEQQTFVNSEGFRSPEFSDHDSTKKKLLLIGDSFTWGFSADPVPDNCFADIIRNETRLEVYNTGVPAADPPQYFAIAKKYIPRIKPDMVLVIFFMGNDLMREDRTVTPDEPFYYYTNAGAILADIDGIHFKSAQAAYDYFVNDKYYLKKPKGALEWIVSKSAILSRIYSVRFRIEEKIKYENLRKDTHITKKYLKGIKEICERNNIPFKLVFIVEIKEANMKVEDIKQRYADLLLDADLKNDWLIPQVKKEFFNDYPDAHLNNKGHRFYADYLKKFLSLKEGF